MEALIFIIVGGICFGIFAMIMSLSSSHFKKMEDADKICDDFEQRIDDANTIDELERIEDELYGKYTTPNPFKNDSVLINMRKPERVKNIMTLIRKKLKWIRYHETNKTT